ncbi:MAG TPA: lytic transglycosylase domain-containing protein [Candidatus Competibacteraceae bacterium]|nr:MAG: lytic transglycosylase [Candidatus Competibacteraceae bacterium]HOB62259.1 lytic transglycosylase domain-containing protein [Candidatus Competibacteraceae bacterium]
MRLRLRPFCTMLTMLVLAACATQPAPPPVKIQPVTTSDAVFPAPPQLQPQIAFWRNVYAVWGRQQVAFHDNRYMDLIYEVVSLPGMENEGYSTDQQALVKMQYETLKASLRQLEFKTAANAPLTPDEAALAAKIRNSSGGSSAIAGASDRLRSQRGLRERFKRGLEISGRYDTAFRGVFREAGLPEDLAYLPHVESSFQNHAASSVGAVGMWQFMPDTAKRHMMMNVAVDERRDPVASAQGAADYLGKAYGRLGSWPLAITSYNHGVGGMSRARLQHGDDIALIVGSYSGKGFGFASRNFYTEFLAAREVARNPQRYFPEGLNYDAPLNLDRIQLRQSVTAPMLASYYEVNLWELNNLNKAWNPPAQNGRIALPAGTKVWLPAGTVARLAQRGSAGRDFVMAETVSATPSR